MDLHIRFTGTERELLQDMVDAQRAELVRCVEGLTEEQARRRLVPSLTTPIALLKHAVFGEQVWFHHRLTGRTREELGIPETVDESFLVGDDETVAGLVEQYREACAESDRIASAYDLDHVLVTPRRGQVSLRWVYLHMIEEVARHAGHADILREQLDAESA